MKKIILISAFVAAIGICLQEMPANAIGPTVIGVTAGNGQLVVNSAAGLNSADLATNGAFPLSITSTTVCTNLVVLNQNGRGNFLAIQITASANTASTTNAIFVLTSSVIPQSPTNNAIGAGQCGVPLSTTKRGQFCQITLPLNGTTASTTNVLYSPATTPAFNGAMNVYLETITPGATASMVLTNYSVAVGQF
jgi:hypothetical protein